MCGSALKPARQDLGLQSCLLFSKLFFQLSQPVGTADVLGDPSAEWDTQWSVSNEREK